MSQDAPRFEDSPAPEPKRSSGCLKWFLILAALGFVGVIGCCGVGYYFFMPKVVKQPAQVDVILQEIADAKMLPEYKGEIGLRMNLGFMQMRMVKYNHSSHKGELQIIEMAVKGTNAGDNAELEAQMQTQKQVQMKSLNVKSTETTELEIRGQSVTFTTVFGQDVSSNTEYYQVEGTFPGKNGPAKLMLQAEAEIWNAEAVTELLESLK